MTNIVLNIEEIQGEGEPEKIARFKCRDAAKLANSPVLVEDTCKYFS